MGKRRFTEDSWRKEPWFTALVYSMLSCKTEEQMANFLRDIATLSELQSWSERLEVAKLLSQGLSYREVATRTGASTTTVTRVAKFIENGEGGYRKVLNTHRHHRMINKQGEVPSTINVPTANAEAASPDDAKRVSILQKYLHTRGEKIEQ